MAAEKRRYWYACEWPHGRGEKYSDDTDAIALWRFTKRAKRDSFVRDDEIHRTIYDGMEARKHPYCYEYLPDGVEYDLVDR